MDRREILKAMAVSPLAGAIEKVKHIERLDGQPGDTLIVHMEYPISASQVKEIQQQFGQLFEQRGLRDVHVVICQGIRKLEILSKK